MVSLVMIMISIWATASFSGALSSIFTSNSGMENLLHAEQFFLEALDKYVIFEKERIVNLERISKHFHKEHEKANSDFQTFISNPLNAFLMMKRLAIDYNAATQLGAHGKEFIKKMKDYSTANPKWFPKEQDLKGAVAGLLRLQDTYQIQTEDMAAGNIGGSVEKSPLSADDCLKIGIISKGLKKNKESFSWMKEALNRYEIEVNKTTSKNIILHHLLFSLSNSEEYKLLYDYMKELMEINRTKSYSQLIEKIKEKLNELEKQLVGDEEEKKSSDTEEMYKEACRGKTKLPLEITSNLSCYYESENHPFLTIAPLKCEELYNNPYIVIYYDVLFDSEIENMKLTTKDKLENASVLTSKTSIVDYRITKIAWLRNNDFECSQNINQRIMDMTGFSLEFAEKYQIANYGIGGYYKPHYDNAQTQREKYYMSRRLGDVGNRLATVLFYMSDVEQGGATVFPILGLTVYPKKGAAIIFINVDSYGQGNKFVKHAACPVLTGDKWIATKWIHEKGHDYLKVCNMEHSTV